MAQFPPEQHLVDYQQVDEDKLTAVANFKKADISVLAFSQIICLSTNTAQDSLEIIILSNMFARLGRAGGYSKRLTLPSTCYSSSASIISIFDPGNAV